MALAGRLDNLYCLVCLMGQDSGVSIPPVSEWPVAVGFDYARLEAQAGRLSSLEQRAFATGEVSTRKRLVTNLQLRGLDHFLNEVFDGPLSKAFGFRE